MLSLKNRSFFRPKFCDFRVTDANFLTESATKLQNHERGMVITMKYSIGACLPLDRAVAAAKLGARCLEPGFAHVASLSEEQFHAGLSCWKESGLPVDSMNSMLPGTAKLYGTQQECEETLDFVRRGMERAAAIGCRNVVFGSGTARNVPDTMTKAEATERLVDMLDRFCDIAQEHHIRIAIEPLRAFETNMINTLSDAAALAALLPHRDNLGVNADIYHMLDAGESFDELGKLGNKLFHVHICAPDRHYPNAERPMEDRQIYRDFFRALRTAGYTDSVSIEGLLSNLEAELPPALDILNAAQDDKD